jgi:hypothetical protein
MSLLIMFVAILSLNWLLIEMLIFIPIDSLLYSFSVFGWLKWAIALGFLAWCMAEDN